MGLGVVVDQQKGDEILLETGVAWQKAKLIEGDDR